MSEGLIYVKQRIIQIKQVKQVWNNLDLKFVLSNNAILRHKVFSDMFIWVIIWLNLSLSFMDFTYFLFFHLFWLLFVVSEDAPWSGKKGETIFNNFILTTKIYFQVCNDWSQEGYVGQVGDFISLS